MEDFGPYDVRQVNEVLASGVVPFNRALGLRAVECGRDYAVVALPYSPDLVGNPETGILHGGAVTALLDATCGLAVFMAMPEPTRIATIDLRIDYMGPATPGREVLARADCTRLTSHVAFTRAVAYHGDPSGAIAAAAATFLIFHGDPSSTAERLKTL
ncbi:MAG: hotdog fold thioesterase [Planctomycetes bacterium]|nr:hotdog fold thioesterase [Planctomycetota bacterium]